MKVLQLINGNARTSQSGSVEQTLPSGFAQSGNAEDASQPFELQMAVQGFAAAEQAAQPQVIAPETLHVSEADAEQWLASVLGQQAVRIEAREAPEQGRDDEIELPDQAALVPVEAGYQTPLQPRDPQLSADTLRVAGAALSGQPQPVVADPSAVLRPLLATEAALTSASSVVMDEAVEAATLERLPVSNADGDKATPGSVASSPTATAAPTEPRTLKLHAPQAQWGEQMLASLREHVDLQINQRIQNATIRLDPPELGSLEIFLSHESGRLSVQLSAANADVARLLQQTSERLRQELVGQNFVQVNVQVSADAQGGRQQQQAQAQAWLAEEAVAAAAVLPAGSERGTTESASDVLVTV